MDEAGQVHVAGMHIHVHTPCGASSLIPAIVHIDAAEQALALDFDFDFDFLVALYILDLSVLASFNCSIMAMGDCPRSGQPLGTRFWLLENVEL